VGREPFRSENDGKAVLPDGSSPHLDLLAPLPDLEAMMHSNVLGFLWIPAVLNIIKYHIEDIALLQIA
jgi:hypothetical protein